MEDEIHFLCFCPKYFTLRNDFFAQKQSPFHNLPSTVTLLGPGTRFSKVPIINGPGKQSPFTLKIEVLIVLHPT